MRHRVQMATETAEERPESALPSEAKASAVQGWPEVASRKPSAGWAALSAATALAKPPFGKPAAAPVKSHAAAAGVAIRKSQSARPAAPAMPVAVAQSSKARATASARAAANRHPPLRAAAGAKAASPRSKSPLAKGKRSAAPAAKQYVGRTALHYAHMKGVAYTLRQTARYAGPTRCMDEAEGCVNAHLHTIRCGTCLPVQ